MIVLLIFLEEEKKLLLVKIIVILSDFAFLIKINYLQTIGISKDS